MLFIFPDRPVPQPDGGFGRDAPLDWRSSAFAGHAPDGFRAAFGRVGLHLRSFAADITCFGVRHCIHHLIYMAFSRNSSREKAYLGIISRHFISVSVVGANGFLACGARKRQFHGLSCDDHIPARPAGRLPMQRASPQSSWRPCQGLSGGWSRQAMPPKGKGASIL